MVYSKTENALALQARIHALITTKRDEIQGALVDLHHDPRLHPLLRREREIWKPLFAICQVIAPQRVNSLLDMAVFLTQRKESRYFQPCISPRAAEEAAANEAISRSLLLDIASLFGDRDRIRTVELITTLLQKPRWKAYENNKGKHIENTDAGQQLLSRLLEPHGVEPKVMKFGKESARGYELASVLTAIANFQPNPVTAQPLPPPPVATPASDEPPSAAIGTTKPRPGSLKTP